jgi:hypothetical protein
VAKQDNRHLATVAVEEAVVVVVGVVAGEEDDQSKTRILIGEN